MPFARIRRNLTKVNTHSLPQSFLNRGQSNFYSRFGLRGLPGLPGLSRVQALHKNDHANGDH